MTVWDGVTARAVRTLAKRGRNSGSCRGHPASSGLGDGLEEFFRAGAVLCRAGEDTSQVTIIDSGWVKVSVTDANSGEKILAVRGQGDVVGERAALTTGVRSATVTALDEVSAMVVPAERFAEFLRGHPRAAEVLERQVTERREEDGARLFPAERAGAERRLAWLLLDLAQRRGGYQHTSAAMFTLPMSQQELADWAETSADAVRPVPAVLAGPGDHRPRRAVSPPDRHRPGRAGRAVRRRAAGHPRRPAAERVAPSRGRGGTLAAGLARAAELLDRVHRRGRVLRSGAQRR